MLYTDDKHITRLLPNKIPRKQDPGDIFSQLSQTIWFDFDSVSMYFAFKKKAYILVLPISGIDVY